MNLVQFCENRYQELSLETQIEREYNCQKDAEMKAIHQILSSYRVILKWILVPKCLVDFTRVQLGFDEEPKAVILEKLKAEQKSSQEMSESH